MQSNRRGGAVQAFWMAGIFAAITYALYASFTQTGIAGYVMKVQMDLWSSASETTTVLLTIGVMMIGFLALAALAERVFPSMGIVRAEAVQRMNRPLKGISWMAILIISLLPVAGGGVVSAFWYRSQQLDAKAEVYSVDLNSAAAALPKDARFVMVTGEIARPWVVAYKKTEDQKVTHEVFAPLTAEGPAGRGPVRYVLHHEASESYDGQVNWPDEFHRKGMAQFSGRVGRRLPAYVVSSLRSKGATLDAAYAVIEWKDLRNRQSGASDSDTPWFIPLAAGGVLALFLMPLMMAVKVKLGRMHRQQHTAGIYV